MDEQDYSQRDIESGVQDGFQHLTRNQYDKAEQCFLRAHQAALALKATSRLNELDQMIWRARDRARWYAQLAQESSALARETDPLTQLAGLENMGRMIGQMIAMGYQESASLARSARHAVIASLDPQQIPELAHKAMERQDYATVVELLEGILTTQGTPAYSLLQRAAHTLKTDVEPKILEASQFLTQSRPLDGLGALQDLRRTHPHCPAWREPWFMLACTQGTFLLEHGRQDMSEAQYAAARSSFKEALQAFELGAEAYPDTCSTQMLLAEAQDLREIAGDLANAQATLQSGQEMEALEKLDATLARLDALAGEGRQYSLIKYEVTLLRQRLSVRVEREMAVRSLLEQASQAINDGDLDQASNYLDQARSGPEDVVVKLAMRLKDLGVDLERRQQQRRALFDEIDALVKQEPAKAIERWIALSQEHHGLGELPPALLNQTLEVAASYLQQRDWNHAREHLDLLREAGIPASQLANLEAMLARELRADQALAAFQSRFQSLRQEGGIVAEYSALGKEIDDWLSDPQRSTRQNEGIGLLAQVRQECEARERVAEIQALTKQVAALQDRMGSARDEADWRAIIADSTALESNLADSDQQSRCRAVVDQASTALALFEKASQSLSYARQLITDGEIDKAMAVLTEAAPAAPGKAHVEIESLIQETRDEQARRQQLRRMTRQVRQSIEAGDWDQAQQALVDCETLRLGSQEIEAIEKTIQAGLRLEAGYRLLEQGQVDLAISRLESAISLAENLPGAELVLADAQAWLKRATEKLEPASRAAPQEPAIGPTSNSETRYVPETSALSGEEQPLLDMLARITRWTIEVEPVLMQARAAFVRGDHQAASIHLLSLGHNIENDDVDRQSPDKEV